MSHQNVRQFIVKVSVLGYFPNTYSNSTIFIIDIEINVSISVYAVTFSLN